jgi:hypothetical protein
MGKATLNTDGQLTTLSEKQLKKLEEIKENKEVEKVEELNTATITEMSRVVEKVVKDPETKERTQKQRDSWARCLEARKQKLIEKRLKKINEPEAKEQVKKSIDEHYENMKTQIIETKDEDLPNTYFIEPKQDRGPKPKPKAKKEARPTLNIIDEDKTEEKALNQTEINEIVKKLVAEQLKQIQPTKKERKPRQSRKKKVYDSDTSDTTEMDTEEEEEVKTKYNRKAENKAKELKEVEENEQKLLAQSQKPVRQVRYNSFR